MKQESKYIRLIRNIALIFFGNICVKAVQFLLIPFYTHYFSPEKYGIVDLITVYTTMLLAIAVCNIYDPIFIFPQRKSHVVQKSYFTTGIVFGIACLAIVSLIFAGLQVIFRLTGKGGVFSDYLWSIFFIIGATFLQNYTQQFARGSDRMIVYVLSGVVYAVGLAVFAFLLVPRYQISGYVISVVAASLCAFIFSMIAGKMYRYISLRLINLKFLYGMLRFSIPLIPATFLWWLINSLNRPILEKCFGLATVGIFAIAMKIPAIMNMMYAIFGNAWQISAVEEYKKQDYANYYNTMFYVVLSFLSCIFCMLTCLSKVIVRLLATPEFFEAWKYIPLLTLSVVFASGAGFVGVNFTARKNGTYFLYSSLLCMAGNLLLNFLLIPKYGMWGAAFSVCFSCMILFFSRIVFAWQFVRIQRMYVFLLLLAVDAAFLFVPFVVTDIAQQIAALLFAVLLFLGINLKFISATFRKLRNLTA